MEAFFQFQLECHSQIILKINLKKKLTLIDVTLILLKLELFHQLTTFYPTIKPQQ